MVLRMATESALKIIWSSSSEEGNLVNSDFIARGRDEDENED